jgi:hypothetical protein
MLGSVFDIGYMFGSVFDFGDVIGRASDVNKPTVCLHIHYVMCLKECFILVMCLGAHLSLVMCMDYIQTDC